MKKFLAMALVAAMSLSMLAGCGAKDNGNTGANTEVAGTEATTPEVTDVALKVWCPQNQIDTGLMAGWTADFAAQHPEWNITWTVEAVGEDVAKDEILKDVEMAGDVFFYANDQVVSLVDAGAIARLGGDVEAMVNETIAAAVVDTVKVDGALYGIPFTHNTFFMYYDKTIFTEDEIKSLDTMVAKETADGVYNHHFDAAGGWKLGSFYYGAGLTVFGADGSDVSAGCDWNSETGVAVTTYLINLINNPKVGAGLTVEELAAEHKVGSWFDGAWNYDKYYEALGEDLGMATIPTYNLNGTEVQLKGFYGSKAIGVNAKSDNLPAAVAFAAYLGSEKAQIERFEKSAQIPTNINAGNAEAVQADAMAAVIVAEANNCSVAQPTAGAFGAKYWEKAGAIDGDIKMGSLSLDNVQDYMDRFVQSLVD